MNLPKEAIIWLERCNIKDVSFTKWLAGNLQLFSDYMDNIGIAVYDYQVSEITQNLIVAKNLRNSTILIVCAQDSNDGLYLSANVLQKHPAKAVIWVTSEIQEQTASEAFWLQETYGVYVFLFLYTTKDGRSFLMPILSPYQVQSIETPGKNLILQSIIERFKIDTVALIPLLGHLLLDSSKFDLHQQAAIVLSSLGEDAIPVLINALFHPSDQIRVVAAKGLIVIGEPSLPFLFSELEKEPKEFKEYIENFFGDSQYYDGKPSAYFDVDNENSSIHLIGVVILKILEMLPVAQVDEKLKNFTTVMKDHRLAKEIKIVFSNFGEGALPQLLNLYLSESDRYLSYNLGSAIIRIGEPAIPEILGHIRKINLQRKRDISNLLQIIDPSHYKKYIDSPYCEALIPLWDKISSGRQGQKTVIPELMDSIRYPNGNDHNIQVVALAIAIQCIKPSQNLLLGLYDDDRNVRECSTIALGIINNGIPSQQLLQNLKFAQLQEQRLIMKTLQNLSNPKIIQELFFHLFRGHVKLKIDTLITILYIYKNSLFINNYIPKILRLFERMDEGVWQGVVIVDSIHKYGQQFKYISDSELLKVLASYKEFTLRYLIRPKKNKVKAHNIYNLVTNVKDPGIRRVLFRAILIEKKNIRTIFKLVTSSDLQKNLFGVTLLESIVQFILEYDNKKLFEYVTSNQCNFKLQYGDYKHKIESFLSRLSFRKKDFTYGINKLIQLMSTIGGIQMLKAISNFADTENIEVRKLILQYISANVEPENFYLILPFLRDSNSDVKHTAIIAVHVFIDSIYKVDGNGSKYNKVNFFRKIIVDHRKLVSDLIHLTRDENQLVQQESKIVLALLVKILETS